MTSWVSNHCGGKRFRTLPDFTVEVEGMGIPQFTPKDAEWANLTKTWKNWAPLIRKYSKKSGVPASYLLAIMSQETGFLANDRNKQASAGSPAGAEGLMQIMPCSVFINGKYKDLVCGRDRKDPSVSLDIGSTLLKAHLLSRGGLPAAASNYNSGGLTCYKDEHEPNVFNWHHEQNYSLKATKYNNAAILQLGVNKPLVPWWAVLIGGVVTLSAGVSVAVIRKRRQQAQQHLLR